MDKLVALFLIVAATILICTNAFGDGDKSMKSGIENVTERTVTEMMK